MLRCDAEKRDGNGAMLRCDAKKRDGDEAVLRCDAKKRDGAGAMLRYDAMFENAMAMKRCCDAMLKKRDGVGAMFMIEHRIVTSLHRHRVRLRTRWSLSATIVW